MNWRILRGWLIVLLVIAGGIAALQYFLMRPVPVDVRITKVKRGLVEETISSTKAGSVRSRKIADLSVEVAGPIIRIPSQKSADGREIREGREVKKGDELLLLDPRDAEAALKVAEKELASAERMVVEAKARWDDAVREHERLKGLLKTESIEQIRVDQAETAVKVTAASHGATQSRVELQEAMVARARLALEKCRLVAPFDGVIAQLFVEEGEWVVPGKVAMRLQDPKTTYIRAEMDEVDLGSIREGLAARVTLDPYKDKKFMGTVTRVSPYVTEVHEQNRTVILEVELDTAVNGQTLKPGTSADVELILRKEPDVLRVPTLAVLEGGRVLVVGPDQIAKAVTIKPGLKNWEYTQVLGGVAEGESVIVSLESEKVKEGVQVKVVQESER